MENEQASQRGPKGGIDCPMMDKWRCGAGAGVTSGGSWVLRLNEARRVDGDAGGEAGSVPAGRLSKVSTGRGQGSWMGHVGTGRSR